MGNEISINIANLIANEIPERILQGMENALQTVENEAKENCPVDDGILRASITHDKSRDGMIFTGIEGTNCEYAPYVHEGTGLYAKNGHGRQNVPWTYKTPDGKYHKTSGQRPNQFLQKAFDDKINEAWECFKEVFE